MHDFLYLIISRLCFISSLASNVYYSTAKGRPISKGSIMNITPISGVNPVTPPSMDTATPIKEHYL